MLKTSDHQSDRLPRPDDERPIGELVRELVDDGKAYARAEVGVVKAKARAKANAIKIPVIMFGAALLLMQAALNVLGVGALLGLAPAVGPVLAGLIVFLIMAAVAGACAWYGAKRLKEDL